MPRGFREGFPAEVPVLIENHKHFKNQFIPIINLHGPTTKFLINLFFFNLHILGLYIVGIGQRDTMFGHML